MSAKHTPGNLRLDTIAADEFASDVALVADNGQTVFELSVSHYSNAPANAARLALCWNTHDQLVAALEWHEQFMPRDGEASSGRYDRIAEVFYKETGYIAPGKDAPMCSGTSYEDRLAAWDKWAKDGLERTRAAIKAAKGEA